MVAVGCCDGVEEGFPARRGLRLAAAAAALRVEGEGEEGIREGREVAASDLVARSPTSTELSDACLERLDELPMESEGRETKPYRKYVLSSMKQSIKKN